VGPYNRRVVELPRRSGLRECPPGRAASADQTTRLASAWLFEIAVGRSIVPAPDAKPAASLMREVWEAALRAGIPTRERAVCLRRQSGSDEEAGPRGLGSSSGQKLRRTLPRSERASLWESSVTDGERLLPRVCDGYDGKALRGQSIHRGADLCGKCCPPVERRPWAPGGKRGLLITRTRRGSSRPEWVVPRPLFEECARH
jgi:hypothetical protein